jgi:hypothetical protein
MICKDCGFELVFGGICGCLTPQAASDETDAQLRERILDRLGLKRGCDCDVSALETNDHGDQYCPECGSVWFGDADHEKIFGPPEAWWPAPGLVPAKPVTPAKAKEIVTEIMNKALDEELLKSLKVTAEIDEKKKTIEIDVSYRSPLRFTFRETE